MKRKAQVLIIFLWILTLLAIMTVSLGNRISMVSKFTQTRRDLLKASYLAYAGINRGIAELKQDNPNYDGLTETWANNEDKFAKIQVTDNPEEYATIKNETGKFGMIDEERKININQASKELLAALLEFYNITPAQEITDNILIWRTDIVPDNNEIYKNLGYPRKTKPFANIAELMLVKGMEKEDFNKISKIITVYGDGKININTASQEVIEILCLEIARKKYDEQTAKQYAKKVAEEFIALRNSVSVFKARTEIISKLNEADGVSVFDEFKNTNEIKSDHFLIEVSANTGKIKTRVAAVYNRSKNYIESWYEG
ncbi:MAG: type II secretion system protein GspK [Candidatus Omnitrophota bacterium]|nr:type II secretion system protein GspK [Candidatus Omnitrophota bacterium]